MKKKFIKKLLFYVILLLITFCINHFVSADTFGVNEQKNTLVALLNNGEYVWQSGDINTTLSYSNSSNTWYPQGLYYEFIIPNVDIKNTYTTTYTMRLTYDYAWGSADEVDFSYYSLYKNMYNKTLRYGIFYNDNMSDYSCNVKNYSSSTYYEELVFTCVYGFLSNASNQKLFMGIQGGGHGSIPFSSNLDINRWDISNTFTTDKTSVIIDQNNTIINQNDETNTKINELNKTQKETNQKLDNINSSLTDSSPISLDKLNDTTGWLPPGPVDSILNLPLSLLNNLSTNLNNQCTPISLTIPFIDKNNTLVLPCLGNTLSENVEGFDTFYSWLGLIVSCLLLYRYLMSLYVWVDNALMLRLEMYEDYGGKPTNFGSV